MAEHPNKLFCNECAQLTSHSHIQLEPKKITPDATLFQRVSVILSNSMDLVLGCSYDQCDHCGSTFGYTDSIGGI